MNRTQRGLQLTAAAADDADDDAAAFVEDATTSDHISDNVCSVETQTEITGDLFDSLNSELQNLRTENIQLRSDVERLSSYYDQSAFVDKDDKVLFHTGLPTWQLLLVPLSTPPCEEVT